LDFRINGRDNTTVLLSVPFSKTMPWQNFRFRLNLPGNATVFVSCARLRRGYGVAEFKIAHYLLTDATVFVSCA